MTRLVRSARNFSQSTAVFALCFAASMVLPLALASVGFHSL